MASLISNDEQVVGRKGASSLPSTGSAGSESEREQSADLEVCMPSHFVEKEAVLTAIQEAVHELSTTDISVLRLKLQPVMRAIEKYREDPCLLDPHVSALVRPIFESALLPHVLSGEPWTGQLSFLSAIVYVIATVVGPTTLTQADSFPHSVSLVAEVVRHLEALEMSPFWESRYVLILWLSVLVMVPFEFKVLAVPDLADRIYALVLSGLAGNKSVAKASSLLLSRLLGRRDTGALRDRFFSAPESPGFLTGLYRTVKLSPLLSEEVTRDLMTSLLADGLRKRAGTETEIFLKTLAELCRFCHPVTALDLLEAAVDRTLSMLHHRESGVRESVAKSLGKILDVLPPVYRAQLVQFLAAIEPQDDFELHSTLLIAGELARRALAVGECVELAVKALGEERTILRTPVKDAACAVVWFLSRKVHRQQLLSTVALPVFVPLVSTSLFERDINLRRSAAAALQELAGRVGSDLWPEGLVAVSFVDFWSVASVDVCFAETAAKLAAAIPSLREPLFNHLVEEKLFAPDPKWQKLASRAIASLLDDANVANSLMARLVEVAAEEKSEWVRRLAAVTCLGEIVGRSTAPNMTDTVQSGIRNLVPILDKKRLFRGKGGDLVRAASYALLAAVWTAHAESRMAFKETEKFRSKCLELLKEGIVHLVDHVQVSAVRAVAPVISTPIVATMLADLRGALLHNSALNVGARRGMILTLALYDAESEATTDFLSKEALSWPKHFLADPGLVDPLARRFACLGLVLRRSTATTVNTLLECLGDFQTDKRGDVGSWVRQVAVEGLLLVRGDVGLASSTLRRIDLALVAHAGERLDRIRTQTFTGLTGARRVDRGNIVGMVLGESFVDLLPLGEVVDEELPMGTETNSPFDLICEWVENEQNDPQSVSDLMEHYVTNVGGLTAQAVSAEAERALLALCSKMSPQKLSGGLVKLLTRPGGRFQSTGDRMNRLFIPAISTLATLVARHADALSSLDLLGLHRNHVLPTLAIPCSATTEFNRLKSVLRLYALFWLESKEVLEFSLSAVATCGVPKLRFAFAQELLSSFSRSDQSWPEELLDVIDATYWLSEKDDDWLPGIAAVAAHFGVRDCCLKRSTVDASRPERLRPDYAELVKEVHRYS